MNTNSNVVEPNYLRPEAAALRLGISKRCLSLWMVRRVIPYRKVGRAVFFRPDELDAALEKFRVASVGEPPTPRKRHTERNATAEHTITPA